MNAKIVITLLLGLVFQLAQVLPGAAVAASCTPLAESCECCASLDSCPCASDGDEEQKPSPLAPNVGNVSKLSAAKSCETRVSIESVRKTHSPSLVAASPAEGPLVGYANVRLSVAFCSFVI